MLLSTSAQIALVDLSPLQPAGLGQLAFYADGHRAGEVTVQVCELCRLGVVHGIRAGVEHRRDLALLAITTLLDRHPDYTWTTTPAPPSIEEDTYGLWAAIGLPVDDTPRTCKHMQAAVTAAASNAAPGDTEPRQTRPVEGDPDKAPSAAPSSHREGESMSNTDNQDSCEHSIEQLADRRSSGTEFAEVMQLLRSSPRTRDLSDDELEQRARNAWAKFEHAPVRSFIPVLVEREVLRTPPRVSSAEH